MTSINELSIWLTFQLSAIFFVGLPLIIFFWSIKKKNKVVEKLLSNYWKISILFFISLILFVGSQRYVLIILDISSFLMCISTWFWRDINSEINEYQALHPLIFVTKVWRWAITFLTISFLFQSFSHIDCLYSIENNNCQIWLEPSKNLYLIIDQIFSFLFGANFSEPVAKFIGIFALIIYFLGLVQWLIIKLPRTGRNSNFSSHGDI